MASKHTDIYGLNQWEATDQVLREDFNADNRNLESALLTLARQAASKAPQTALDTLSAALTQMPRIAVGSYTGTGRSGRLNPNTLTFDFQPKLLLILAGSTQARFPATVFIQGQTQSSGFGVFPEKDSPMRMNITWSGNSVQWHSALALSSPDNQFNDSQIVYYYFAIGV